MGLIKCPDCGKVFSDRIDACPNCGCPKTAAIAERNKEPVNCQAPSTQIEAPRKETITTPVPPPSDVPFQGLRHKQEEKTSEKPKLSFGNTEEISRKKFGMKWFTFYTKVRPWFSCFFVLSVILDFIQYTDVYVSNWWLLLYFLAAIAQPVFSIMVFIKSKGDYVDFARFVKGVLLFETINTAYQLGVQQYLKSNLNIGNALVMTVVALLICYFVWYRLNVKYFEKRMPSVWGSSIDFAKEEVKIVNDSSVSYPPDNTTTYGNTRVNMPVKRRRGKKIGRKTKVILIIVSIVILLAICIPITVLYYNSTQKIEGTVGVRIITFSDKFTAEYIFLKWQNGMASEGSMIQIMNEYGEEQGGAKVHFIEPGEFVKEIDDWCFSSKRKVGDAAVIESSYGYSICYISTLPDD